MSASAAMETLRKKLKETFTKEHIATLSAVMRGKDCVVDCDTLAKAFNAAGAKAEVTDMGMKITPIMSGHTTHIVGMSMPEICLNNSDNALSTIARVVLEDAQAILKGSTNEKILQHQKLHGVKLREKTNGTAGENPHNTLQ